MSGRRDLLAEYREVVGPALDAVGAARRFAQSPAEREAIRGFETKLGFATGSGLEPTWGFLSSITDSEQRLVDLEHDLAALDGIAAGLGSARIVRLVDGAVAFRGLVAGARRTVEHQRADHQRTAERRERAERLLDELRPVAAQALTLAERLRDRHEALVAVA